MILLSPILLCEEDVGNGGIRAVIDGMEQKLIDYQQALKLTKEEKVSLKKNLKDRCASYGIDIHSIPSDLSLLEQHRYVSIWAVFSDPPLTGPRGYSDLFARWQDPDPDRPLREESWIPLDCRKAYTHYLVAYEMALTNLLRMPSDNPPAEGALILPIHNEMGGPDGGLAFDMPIYRASDLENKQFLAVLRAFHLVDLQDKLDAAIQAKAGELIGILTRPPREAVLDMIQRNLVEYLTNDHTRQMPVEFNAEIEAERSKEIDALLREKQKTGQGVNESGSSIGKPEDTTNRPILADPKAMLGPDLDRYRAMVKLTFDLEVVSGNPDAKSELRRQTFLDASAAARELVEEAETTIFRAVAGLEMCFQLTAGIWGWGLRRGEHREQTAYWVDVLVENLTAARLGIPEMGIYTRDELTMEESVRYLRAVETLAGTGDGPVPIFPLERPDVQMHGEITGYSGRAPVVTTRLLEESHWRYDSPNKSYDRDRVEGDLQDKATQLLGWHRDPASFRYVLEKARDLPRVYEPVRAVYATYLLRTRAGHGPSVEDIVPPSAESDAGSVEQD